MRRIITSTSCKFIISFTFTNQKRFMRKRRLVFNRQRFVRTHTFFEFFEERFRYIEKQINKMISCKFFTFTNVLAPVFNPKMLLLFSFLLRSFNICLLVTLYLVKKVGGHQFRHRNFFRSYYQENLKKCQEISSSRTVLEYR